MNPLNVLYQTNESYAVVTGVSMISLMENNLDVDEIRFYILDDKMGQSSRPCTR
jgi:lipopolysaccharide biosynthesis glycosyltransferase